VKELVSFAEIEYTQPIKSAFTAVEPGIWCFCLYAVGELLPFMEDTFNRTVINISNVIIDQREYNLFDSLDDLRTMPGNKRGYVNARSIIYVRFENWSSPYIYISHRYGVLYGFTNSSPVLLNERMYRPGLLSGLKAEQSADVFTYDKMKFNSATISIDNTNGQFDDVENLFGNEFNLFIAVRDDAKEDVLPLILKLVAQYYIANISVNLEKADFHLKDKRERLSAKIPDQKFDDKKYPHIDDNLIDRDMQEAYGSCFGVPGVCLHGKQIFAKDNEPKDEDGYLEQYRFRFSSEITRVDRIQVKMTSGKIADPNGETGDTISVDGWTTIYRSTASGNPDFEDWDGWKEGLEIEDEPPPGDIVNFLDNGIITLRWDIAKQGIERTNQMNEVRMDGVFNNKLTPLEIIKDILYEYSDVPIDGDRYYEQEDILEIDKELAPLNYYEMGILFDNPVTVYEAIEKIQSGCAIGFQFQVYENKYTARLDNPNRKEDPDIHCFEILNLNEIEIDWNAELYGTHTNIEYRHNYVENSGRHWIDTLKRMDILDKYRVEKEWTSNTLLADEEGAEFKSNLLLEDFIKLRPVIKNIKLHGEKWFNLRVYDIRHIDFRIPGKEYTKQQRSLIRLIDDAKREKTIALGNTSEYIALINDEKENIGSRKFADKVRCQILRVDLDTQTGISTIDVRVREVSDVWKEEAKKWQML